MDRGIKKRMDIDPEDESSLLENVQALVEKERRLLELQLLEKENELQALRSTVNQSKQKKKRFLKQQESNSFPDSETHYRSLIQEESDDEEGEEDEEEADTSTEESNAIGGQVDLGDPHSLAKLSHLNLRGQRLTEVDLKKLGQALVHAKSVSSLDISDNSLGKSAAPFIAAILAHARIGLTSLDISENRLSLEDAVVVAKGLAKNQTLTSLSMARNPFFDQVDAGSVLGSVLGHGPRQLSSISISIGETKRDRKSNTKQGNCSSFITGLFALHPGVTSLSMTHCSLPKVAVAALASEALARYFLVHLDLSMAFIGSNGAAILGKALHKANTEQDMKRRASKATAVGGAARDRLCLLETLILKMNAIGAAGCKWIARAIGSSTSLLHVDLSSNDLADISAKDLARALETSQAPLRRLNLSRNRFFGAATGSQSGADALCEAIRKKFSLVDLGPMSHLHFSVRVKRILLRLLSENQARSKLFATTERKTSLPKEKGLVVFEQPGKMLLLDCPLSRHATPLVEDSVEVARFNIPDVCESDIQLVLEWETTPAFDWRILRKRRPQVFEDTELQVVLAGDNSSSSQRIPSVNPQDKVSFWNAYSVITEGWRTGDEVIIELGTSPGQSLSSSASQRFRGALLQAIQARVLSEKLGGSKDDFVPEYKNVSGYESRLEDDPVAGKATSLLHSRHWQNDILLQVSARDTANVYTRVHDIFVHSGTRWGRLVLRWNVRIQTLDGKVIDDKKRYHNRVAGADWKITKNGAAFRVLSGSHEDSRITVQQDDFAFATYSVDLSNLDVFIGDTISLWLRPPTQLLPASSQRRASSIRPIFTLHSTFTELVLAGNEKEIDSCENRKLDLAGRTPFRLAASPFAWA